MTMPLPPFMLAVFTVYFLVQPVGCSAFAPPRNSRNSVGSSHTRIIAAVVNAADDTPHNTTPKRSTVATEIPPLKAAMLTKSWQSLLAEVDQKVGIVPELGRTSVGVQRFGPELARRTRCKREFEFLHASAFGLALADKNAQDAGARLKMRAAVPGLANRGAGCRAFATLTAPATMSLVDDGGGGGGGADTERYWSVLALIVNPTERALPVVIASEREALDALRALAGTTVVRIEARVMDSLAGSCTDLGIVPVAVGEDGEDVRWLLSVTEAS